MALVQGVDSKIRIFWQNLEVKSREDRLCEIWKAICSYLSPSDRFFFASTSRLGCRIALEVEKEQLSKTIEQCVRALFCINAMLTETQVYSSLRKAASRWENSHYHSRFADKKWPLTLLCDSTWNGYKIVHDLACLQDRVKNISSLQGLSTERHEALVMLNKNIPLQTLWFLPCLQRMFLPQNPHVRLLVRAFHHNRPHNPGIEGNEIKDMLAVVMPYVQTRNFSALKSYFLAATEENSLEGKADKAARRQSKIAKCIKHSADGTSFAWHVHDLFLWHRLIRELVRETPSLQTTQQWLQHRLVEHGIMLLSSVPKTEDHLHTILDLVEQVVTHITSPHSKNELLVQLWAKQISRGCVSQFWNSLMRHVKNKPKGYVDHVYTQAIVLLALVKPPKAATAIKILREKLLSRQLKQQIANFLPNVKPPTFVLRPDPQLTYFHFSDYKPTKLPCNTQDTRIHTDILEDFKTLIEAYEHLETLLEPVSNTTPLQRIEIEQRNRQIQQDQSQYIDTFVQHLNLMSTTQLKLSLKMILGDPKTAPHIFGLLGYPPQNSTSLSQLDYYFLKMMGLASGKFKLNMQDTLLLALRFAHVRGDSQEIYFPLALELLRTYYKQHKSSVEDPVELMESMITDHIILFPMTLKQPKLRKYWLTSMHDLAHPNLRYNLEDPEIDLFVLELLFQKLSTEHPTHVLPVFCDLIALAPRYEHPHLWQQWLSLANLPIWNLSIEKRKAQHAIFQRLLYSCPQLAKMPRKTWMCLLNPTVFYTVFPEPEYDFDDWDSGD